MSTLTAGITREKALEKLKQYHAEAFHIRHGLTVEAVMGWMAEELGHGEDREFWALAGLLHDVDFEKWPEEHCVLGHDGHRLQARAGDGEGAVCL